MDNYNSPVYTNITNLPQVFNITDGDFLIVENPQGTNIIDFKDVVIPIEQTPIGGILNAMNDTMSVINSNLSLITNVALPSIMNVRMSLSPNTATPTTNLTGSNAATLYVHPFRGDAVTLYSPTLSAWQSYTFATVISQSLATICNAANTTYDIYLSLKPGGGFNITSEVLPSFVGGVNFRPYRRYVDGVAVHRTDPSKRLIGCLRTVNTPGQSIQTFNGRLSGGFHSKQFVWNAYNQIPVSCWGFDSGVYYAVSAVGLSSSSTGWRKVNPVVANNTAISDIQRHRFSFIVGDYTAVNFTGQIYPNVYDPNTVNIPVGVCGAAIDSDGNLPTPDNAMLLGEQRGSDSNPRTHVLNTFESGYHFIQLLEQIYCGSLTITLNESAENMTGYIATLNM